MTAIQEKAGTEIPSALHGSIQNKKDISYYYAHAPRDTGEKPADAPVHRAIATTAHTPEDMTVPIKTHQFLDDGDWVKVYLPMEKLDTITQDNIEATFERTSLSVRVSGLRKEPLLFNVAALSGEIVPEECKAKLLKTKILVKLKKAKKVKTVKKKKADAAVPGKAMKIPDDPEWDPLGDETEGERKSDILSAEGGERDALGDDDNTAENKVTTLETEEAKDEENVEDNADEKLGEEEEEEEEVEETPHWYQLRK